MPQPASLDAPRLEDTSAARRAAVLERRRAALDDRKRSFLRMVSHELRTPLNAVLGFSEILSRELYGPLGAPQYREYAQIVNDSGLKLLKLVNQIVEIARLEGHVTDLDLAPEALDEAIEDAIEQLRPEIDQRQIAIAVPGEGDLPSVLADSRGLRTMLGNLLQNAITHSPVGGQVSVIARAVPGGVVEIAIADHGAGVEPEDLPRLLRPFEQGGCALTRSSEGAGLGLPIVDLLARAMNGGLRLTSRPGSGLTAQLTLPEG
ncbi:MAG: HAMP domain-containing histidine kinase [Alphaproteobacteria bacterium]|nr:HAMP domain-containing histidine kinase [Alphaproteobacteria bacterium]